MDIIDGKIILDDEDREFLAEMVVLGLVEDIMAGCTLRSLARAWYERGYYDRVDEEEYAD